MYLMGESLGAALSAQVAAADPEKFAGIVLFTPWKSLATLVNEKFAHIPLSLLLRERLDTAAALDAYTGHVVIVGAGNDTIIPPGHARALADANKKRHYFELQDAGHNDWYDALQAGQWDRLLRLMSGTTSP